jgi:hypothetical protein
MHAGIKTSLTLDRIYQREVRVDTLVRKRHGASSARVSSSINDTGGSAKVYIATTPLVGMELIEEIAKAAGRELPQGIALHTVVVVQEHGEDVSACPSSQTPVQRLKHLYNFEIYQRTTIH